ncbi:MAG TPA: glycosyltransferase family 2 protein [Pseudosphingobacterium sp.]|nr:glycosyltransferase family 2 protein [Pseudosphingobacterium sp.]
MNSNSRRPFFTIITATFNSGKVIGDCLNSVRNQSYSDYEHLIIDGKSLDNTMEIVENFGSGQVRWISEADYGIYDAWNKGIKLVQGKWVMFLGSDDILYPNALEKYAATLSNRSFPEEIEFVSSKIHMVDSKGKIYRTVGKAYKWSEFKRSVKIAHPGSLHKITLFEKYGLYDTNYKICGDYEFLLRAGDSLRATYVDFVAVAMSDGGISNNNRQKVFKEHYRAVTQTGRLNRWIATYDYISLNLKAFIRDIVVK